MALKIMRYGKHRFLCKPESSTGGMIRKVGGNILIHEDVHIKIPLITRLYLVYFRGYERSIWMHNFKCYKKKLVSI